MNADTIVERAVSLVAFGLIKRDHISETRPGYIPCLDIAQGAAMFLAFACNEGGKGMDILDYAHERAFMEEYATKPVKEWFNGFDEKCLKPIRNTAAWETGPLCLKIGDASNGFKFIPTDECYDLAHHWFGKKDKKFIFFNDLIANMDEKRVFECLEQLHEQSPCFYVKAREYLIKNPSLFEQEDADMFLDQFRNSRAASDIARDILDKAYESTGHLQGELFVCPTCGWIMSRMGKTIHCSTDQCSKMAHSKGARLEGGIFPRRLRLGVMKYICIPGKLECKIFDLLERSKCNFEKWPLKDTYDALVAFPDGERWAIDAKAWRNIDSLVRNIRREGGMPGKDRFYDRGFYVLDDIHKKEDLAIDGNLAGIPGCEKAQCVNFSGFKRELARKLGAL